ncbi:MAG: protein kinase [Alphaproteobacteria bacterium]|nr:protein kinase [Alphaproteobacteria bacterium]
MTNIIALDEGTNLVGDYTVERVLGAGGFGITYLAREMALDRAVTIKEYFPSDFAARKDGFEAVPRSQESAGDYRWGLERFVSEAQTLAKFNHPHIVGVHRYFRANNTAYMVLHYEEGQSLKSWLKNLGRVPRQADLDKVVAPLLDALENIHNADFLHRDIAPDNIIIRKNGQPVLIDFGSARGEIARHSKTISALVKPGYSPYEQYAEKNSRQGPWTDIYALGATLYFAVTKKRPPDSVLRVTKDEYRPVSELAMGSYRKRFLRAIDTALAVDISSRPQSVAAWRGELLAPDEPRRSWLSGRKPPPADTLNLSEDTPLPGPSTSPIPPPPDAPGKRGGMLDFVDDLKQPDSPAPGAARAASRGAADAAVKTNPNKKGRNQQPPAANHPGEADPLPNTVRLEVAPTPLFPKKRKAAAAKAASPRQRANPPEPTPEPFQNEAPEPRLPVPVEAKRKPARPPGEALSKRGARWGATLMQLMLAGGIVTAAIVYRDKLPEFDFADLGNIGEQLKKSVLSAPGNAPNARSEPPTPPRRTPTQATTRSAALEKTSPNPPPPRLHIKTIAAHSGPVLAIAYSPDGRRIISTGTDATLRIWNVDTGTPDRVINLGNGPATSLAVRQRYAATGHENGATTVWDLEAGTKIAHLRRNEARIWSVTFTNSGRLAIAGHDWTVSLWDMRKPDAPIHVFEGHKNPVQTIALSSNGTLLASGGADKQLHLWDLNTLDRVRAYRKQGDFITAIGFSANDRLIASGTLSGKVSIFRTKSRSRVRRINGHGGKITGLKFSSNDRLLITSSKDGTLRVIETKRWRTIKTIPDHQGAVNTLAIAPDGRSFASAGEDGSIRIWSTAAFQR